MNRVSVPCAAVAAVICGLGGCERSEREDEYSRYSFAGGSVRLDVPNGYLITRRGWWSSTFTVLDTNADQLAIRVPEEHLRRLLQAGSLPVRSYAMLLRTVRKSGAGIDYAPYEELAARVNAAHNRNPRIVKLDPRTGLYFLALRPPGGGERWIVLESAPPVRAEFVIAVCVRYTSNIYTSCQLRPVVVGQLRIDPWLAYEYLDKREIFRDYLADLVEGWITTP